MSPFFPVRADAARDAQIPSTAAQDAVRAVMIRRLSSDFYHHARKASDKELEAGGSPTVVDVPATPAPAPAPTGKPPRTGWRRYIGIMMTFSASLNFSFGVLFAKLLQAYDYHGNGASFWRYMGVSVPAVPLLLFYEFGYLCRPGPKEQDISTAESQDSSSSAPYSVASSQISIVSKETETRAKRNRRTHVSTFSTVWPLTDSDKAKQAVFVILRSTFAAVAVVLRYYALEYMSIADTSVISYSTPVLVTIMAHFMLGEKAGIISFLVAFTTLVGVVIVAKPPILTGEESFTTETLIGTGFATASLFCASMQIVLTRKVRSVHFALLTLTVGFIGLGIASALMFHFQDFQYPVGWSDGLLVAGLTGTSFLGQMSIILALKFEQAGPVALIRTSDVVIGFVLQYAFMHVIPEWTSVVGGSIVVSGVLVTGARKFLQELPEYDDRRRRFRVLLL